MRREFPEWADISVRPNTRRLRSEFSPISPACLCGVHIVFVQNDNCDVIVRGERKQNSHFEFSYSRSLSLIFFAFDFISQIFDFSSPSRPRRFRFRRLFLVIFFSFLIIVEYSEKLETEVEKEETLTSKIRDAFAKSACYLNSVVGSLSATSTGHDSMPYGVQDISQKIRCSLQNTGKISITYLLP